MSAPETPSADAFWVAEAHRPHFAKLGLTGVAHVLSADYGQCLRRLPDRENWRWELPGEADSITAFVKKHHARRSIWPVGAARRASAGLLEALRIEELAGHGLTSMRLVAYGAEPHAAGDRSFLITEELAGHEPLDDFLRKHFAPRSPRAAPRDRRLDALLEAVAAVAARFHGLGYNHRDFYACHFFVREPSAGAFEISLIDLQRVQRRRRGRRRWIVKDLAQLAHSLPRDRVGCTDRLRMLRRYLGVARLRPRDHRLIRAVLAKVRAIGHRR